MFNMASKGPKRESLSRYFKDLDESECSSDASDDEINKDDKNPSGKTNVSKSQNNSGTPVGGKLKHNNSTENESSSTPAPSKLASANTEKYADVNCDAGLPNKQNKLPSASECLNTKSTPSFLKISEKKEVNWDSCQKRLDGDGDEEGTLDFKSNAVPPPSSYEPITDPGIKVVDSEGRKRKIVGNELEDQMTSTKAYKVHKENDDKEAVNDTS